MQDVQAKAKGKGAQDSAAKEEAVLRLGDGRWPSVQALGLGAKVIRANRIFFALSSGMSLVALVAFGNYRPVPSVTANGLVFLALTLALLGHALAIERTQRYLEVSPRRSPDEALLDWGRRLPALVGTGLLVVGLLILLDAPLNSLSGAGPLAALLGFEVILRFTGFPLHEVVAGESNPLRAVWTSARLGGRPLRAVGARCLQWIIIGGFAWVLGMVLGVSMAAGDQLLRELFPWGSAMRGPARTAAAFVLAPFAVTYALYFLAWVQTSWAAYHMLRKEAQECLA